MACKISESSLHPPSALRIIIRVVVEARELLPRRLRRFWRDIFMPGQFSVMRQVVM